MRKAFVRFAALMRNSKCRAPIPEMSLERSLNTVAIAYEAIFVDPGWLGSMSFHTGLNISLLMSKAITPEVLQASQRADRYKALVDGWHGGLLNLSMSDPKAFSRWYASGARSGQHPFEIVAGDRGEGILPRIEPVGAETEGRVYELSVHISMIYAMAVRMALALECARVPLVVRDYERVIGGLVLRRERPAAITLALSRKSCHTHLVGP